MDTYNQKLYQYIWICNIMGRLKENLPKFERTSITLPRGTLDKAKKVGLNVSAYCSIAIQKAIAQLEDI